MGNFLKCISPIDNSIYAERETLTFEEAEKKIEFAKKTQSIWNNFELSKRVQLISKAIKFLGDWNTEIVEELAWQMGRPVRYGGEYGGVKERSDYMLSIAEEGLKNIEIENSKCFKRIIKRVPHGTVFVIAPWNYPYLTAINTIVPALVSGNCVLLKHSTQTMLVGERFEKAFNEAGLPKGIFQNLFLDHRTTEKLISNNKFNFINFTGSVEAGKKIEKAASGTFTNLGLELGGKDPGYVLEDCDIEKAAETLVDGAMFNSGQCCCGIERIYVSSKIFDDFIEIARSIVNNYVLGNPFNEETTLGPMANIKFADLVRRQIDEAIELGANPLIDNSLFKENKGTYLMPQILINVDHNMELMKHENFGPVIGIVKVSNDEEAIKLMNDSSYGLSASLWTNDILKAEHIGNQIQTGTVYLNRCDYLDPALCWTGVKDTGKGGSLSEIGYHNLTKPKSYHFKIN
tara:strand:+ start:305 stop:1684 length:1380 start_codon:yes stop_codon:yes gene_type:complete